jgi:hypothetical protein
MNLLSRLQKLESAVDAAGDTCGACGHGMPPTKPMRFAPIEYDGDGRQIKSPPPAPCAKCGRTADETMKFFPITLDGDKTVDGN